MPIQVKDFSGKLNMDDHPYKLPQGDYMDAMNITKDARGDGQDEIVSNVVGNELVNYSVPSGYNKVIGAYADKLRGRFYYFLWNSDFYYTILYYDARTDTVQKVIQNLTDSTPNENLFEFDPSKKIFNVNVIHGDEDQSDILCFIDSAGTPIKINVDSVLNYAPVKAEFLMTIKAPPSMPPKVVYENDNSVTNNNVKKKLFRLASRYWYDDNEKSVWSSQSKAPLPYQPFDPVVDRDVKKNSRIAAYVQTGDKNVKKIEIAAIEGAPDSIVGPFLVATLDKAELGIPDNSIYRFVFYNDSVYPFVEANDAVLLFDNVPIKAAAQELLNGNVLLYGNITEGYDLVPIDATASTFVGTKFSDPNGTLFFGATDAGYDSGGPISNKLYLYLTGYGTNDSNNNPSTLENARVQYSVNAVSGNGTNISFSYTGTSDSLSVSSILSSIQSQAAAQGWQLDSIGSNTLVLSHPQAFYLQSTTMLVDRANTTPNNNNSVAFVDAFASNYSYAIAYFDKFGRTNGALNKLALNVTTQYPNFSVVSGNLLRILQPQNRIEINSRPPIWAAYYHILKSKNLTYSKLLSWVTSATTTDYSPSTLTSKYGYINIANIATYNTQLSGSQGIVSYEYEQGDRIKFLYRFPSNGSAIPLTVNDVDILAYETNPTINGVVKEGSWLKVDLAAMQTALGDDADYQNYAIVLYNYAKHSGAEGTVFFETGLKFGIGRAGTDEAYHMGSFRTQSADLSLSAIVDDYAGDYFARYRTVPLGPTYTFTAGDQSVPDFDSRIKIVVPNSPITTSSYEIKSTPPGFVQGGSGSPQWSDNNWFIWNKGTSIMEVNFKGAASFIFNQDLTWYLYLRVCSNGGGYPAYTDSSLFPVTSTLANQVSTVSFDYTIKIPPNGRLYPLHGHGFESSGSNPVLRAFQLKVSVIKDITIPVVDVNYADNLSIKLNSYGRANTIEPNAKQVTYPTLVRFSGEYQPGSSNNGTSRFFPENLDEYDRNFGPIMRLHVRDRRMFVYQRLKVGWVPILTQVIKDTTGNPLEANSDQLINKIQYFSGDFGIGDVPESLAWNNFADYFCDDLRGVVLRLGADGIVPISILAKMNAFFIERLKYFQKELNNGIAPAEQFGNYLGDPKIYGAFDAYTNEYIICMEEIARYSDPDTLMFYQEPYTMVYSEAKNEFRAKRQYYPEWIGCLDTLLISFKNGQLWRHNSSTFCNFYGVQYGAYIQAVFNANGIDKKTWKTLSETANVVWECPEIESQLDSYGAVKQSSVLIPVDFVKQEGQFNASFLRDENSIGGIINGDELKGNYLIVTFEVKSAPDFVYLAAVTVSFINSPLNKR